VLVSSTYNMLLPTQIGGDVVRAMRCAARISDPCHAWSSTLFERIMGVLSLVVIALGGLLMAPSGAGEMGIAICAVALISVLAMLLAHAPFRFGAKLLVNRAPSVAGATERIAADLAGPLGGMRARVEMMGWSLAYQAAALGILVVVVVQWKMATMIWAVLGAVPLALVLTLLPVSIAGLGVRESLFVVLLGRFGMSADRALSLAVVWLASSVLAALAGGVVMIVQSVRGSGRHP